MLIIVVALVVRVVVSRSLGFSTFEHVLLVISMGLSAVCSLFQRGVFFVILFPMMLDSTIQGILWHTAYPVSALRLREPGAIQHADGLRLRPRPHAWLVPEASGELPRELGRL